MDDVRIEQRDIRGFRFSLIVEDEADHAEVIVAEGHPAGGWLECARLRKFPDGWVIEASRGWGSWAQPVLSPGQLRGISSYFDRYLTPTLWWRVVNFFRREALDV